MSTLDVRFVGLSECLVSSGYRLELNGADAPGIHYNLAGTGKAYVGDDLVVDLAPHTLIVVPAHTPFHIEVARDQNAVPVAGENVVNVRETADGTIFKFVAGGGDPEIVLVCGFFMASYGASANLFETLTCPIVEQFAQGDHVDARLKLALSELIAQETGSGAMSAALLKQVIIAILRRSLTSANLWVERFSMLSAPQIALAFSYMAAHPGAAHTVQSLAQSAYLSRSAFMARFTEMIGKPPMIVLRDLRMRQAAQQLRATSLPIDHIAHDAGYENRSSFVRAFKKAFGSDPSDYRAKFKV